MAVAYLYPSAAHCTYQYIKGMLNVTHQGAAQREKSAVYD